MNSEMLKTLPKKILAGINDFLLKLGSADSINDINALILTEIQELVPFSKTDITIMKIIQPHFNNFYSMLTVLEKFTKLQVLKEEIGTGNGILSIRESEITNMLIQRYKPADIAEELVISIFTVRKHIQNIYEKLHVTDRKQLFQKIYNNYSKRS